MRDTAASTTPRPSSCGVHLTELLRLADSDQASTIAARLLDRFGSLGGVFAATPEARSIVIGDHANAKHAVAVVGRVMQHITRARLSSAPLLNSLSQAVEFLTLHLAYQSAERVETLFLDCAGKLIRHETTAIGSIDTAPIFPREIVKRALELGAGSLILAHNHPSGDPMPSSTDIAATRKVAAAAALFDIDLFDHLIVARGEWTSFRALGLL